LSLLSAAPSAEMAVVMERTSVEASPISGAVPLAETAVVVEMTSVGGEAAGGVPRTLTIGGSLVAAALQPPSSRADIGRHGSRCPSPF
jgi:hypothetical protein